MAFELTGKVIEIYDTIQVSDSFRKREFVLESRENASGTEFTNYMKFQLTQERCTLIDQVKINDDIRVSFNIRGNRWEREGNVRYFTNLDVWKIEKLQDEQAAEIPPPLTENDLPPQSEEFDDLPF